MNTTTSYFGAVNKNPLMYKFYIFSISIRIAGIIINILRLSVNKLDDEKSSNKEPACC